MQMTNLKTETFYSTGDLGLPAEIKAGFFISKTPVENKEEFLRAAWKGAGFKERKPVYLKQVHSGTVHTFLNGSSPDTPPTGDAIVTDSKDSFLVIQVADCLPVLIFDPVKKLVAGAHCGWKGSLLGLANRTVDKMVESGSKPVDLRVWFGPSIRSCCYEVGVERTVLFPHLPDRQRNIDLVEFNRELLETAGIDRQKLVIDPRCTACAVENFERSRRADKLPSYRREGNGAGRLFVYAALG